MDTLLPITVAATRYNVSERELKRLIQAGRMREMSYDGVTLVSEEEVKDNLPRKERAEYKQFAHLQGKGIGQREASRKYNVSQPTISRWVQNGLINVINPSSIRGQKKLIDEADVAYCAFIFLQNAGQGKWTLRHKDKK